ncbi:hypothetical protein [Vibrio sp. Hep-1b-8]|nr:hypothetical protein [Vibrio sp. Hep-1b-8]
MEHEQSQFEWFGAGWLFGLCFAICLTMIWLYAVASRTEDRVEREVAIQ